MDYDSPSFKAPRCRATHSSRRVLYATTAGRDRGQRRQRAGAWSSSRAQAPVSQRGFRHRGVTVHTDRVLSYRSFLWAIRQADGTAFKTFGAGGSVICVTGAISPQSA